MGVGLWFHHRRLQLRVMTRIGRKMNWSRQFSPVTRTVLVVFGGANFISALVSPFTTFGRDALLPGMFVGATLAVVGIKGGYPLIPTAGPDSISLGLSKIRRRRFLVYLAALGWLLIAGPILMRVPESVHFSAFTISAMFPEAAFVIWGMSACPRCGNHFFIKSGSLARFPRSCCQHCGLGLHDA